MKTFFLWPSTWILFKVEKMRENQIFSHSMSKLNSSKKAVDAFRLRYVTQKIQIFVQPESDKKVEQI